MQPLEVALTSVFRPNKGNNTHYDYSRLDDTCPCDICSSWRRARDVYCDVQQPVATHPDDCHCLGCIAARRHRAGFLAADNRRTLFCEIGFHVQDDPRAPQILKWIRSEFTAENRSDSWWASRGENYSIAYWLQRYERQLSSPSTQTVTPPKNRNTAMAEDWKKLWFAEYQARRAQHDTDRRVKMEQIAAIQAQLDEAIRALDEHDNAAALMALHYAIPLVSGESGYIYSDHAVERMPLFQMCIAIVRDAGPGGMTTQQIFDRAAAKGYSSTLASISTIMLKISKSGAIAKNKDTGKWYVAEQPDTEPESTLSEDEDDAESVGPMTITAMIIESLANTDKSSLSRAGLENAVSALGGDPSSVGFRQTIGRLKKSGKIVENDGSFSLP